MHDFGVRNVWEWRGMKVIEVLVEQARYFGRKWLTLSLYEKRKFENVLFLKSHDEKLKTKILYVDYTGRRLAESR